MEKLNEFDSQDIIVDLKFMVTLSATTTKATFRDID